MNTQIDLNQVRSFLLELLPKAGSMLEKYFYLKDLRQVDKGGVDFATEADFAVDKFLRKEIARKYPQIPFLTEETAPKDFSIFKNEEILWVIDPLDGTTNFSRGDFLFAISVGLVKRGVPQLGAIYVPMEKKIYWAQDDQPNAMLNNKKLVVSKINDLKTASLFVDWGYKPKERQETLRYLSKIITSFRQVKNIGSLVVALGLLVEGKTDAYIAIGHKPWDVAAISLIIKKSGGKITTPEGGAWEIFKPDIFVSNSLLHDQVLKLLL